jgi:hypothetical protein
MNVINFTAKLSQITMKINTIKIGKALKLAGFIILMIAFNHPNKWKYEYNKLINKLKY